MPTKVAASDRAYDATKELIVSGELAGGTMVTEGEIAQQLELSRTPVREAFLRLEAEDFLRLIPKRGAVVVPVSSHEAADILDVRHSLECGAVSRLVTVAELEQTLNTLHNNVAEQRALAAAGEVAAFAAADTHFHQVIVTASANCIAERFYASLADRQQRMTVKAMTPQPAAMRTLVSEHAGLIDCIAARDLPGFSSQLRSHFERTHRTLLTS